MAKTKISEYSATSANNTDISNINIAEGCSPANVNNAIRTLMAQIKDLQAGTSGDTIPLTAGGTGSTTAGAARTALSAAAAGANSDITSLTACTSITGLTTTLSTLQGGTGAIQKAISNVARTSNVVTITTSTAHGFLAGHYVTIAAITNTGLNGTFLIATVATSTFTYAQTGTDITSVADTGTALDITYCNLANNVTGTLPSANLGTVPVASGGTGATTLTSGSVLVGAGTSTPTFVAPTTTGNVLFTTNGTSWSSTPKITSETSQATTSGTAFNFTSIPSWVKRVTVMINNFAISGSTLEVRLGTSGGIVSTGYVGSSGVYINGNATDTGGMSSSGMSFGGGVSSGYGVIVFTNISGNIWMAMGNYNNASTRTGTLSGSISLASALTQLRLTTTSGTATFSSGSVNIMYE